MNQVKPAFASGSNSGVMNECLSPFVKPPPCTKMHAAKGPSPLRHESVERQRHLTRLRELNVLLQAGKAEGLRIGRVADGSSSEEEEQGEKFHGNKTRQLARFTSHDSQALRIVASIFNLTILANKIVAQQFCWLLFRV